MKSKTLLRILLFLPYLIWAIAIPFTALPTKSILQGIVTGISIVYTFGIVFWGIPYTILIIGVLFWSRNKSTKEVYAALSQSPLWLALITIAELIVIDLYLGLTSEIRFSLLEDLGNFVIYSFIAMFTIFIYGYVFVFLGKAVYRVLDHLKWIKDEEEFSQNTSSYSSEFSTSSVKSSEN